ncbi:type IV secretory system conjugative DNA transfer family protein [Methylobacter sp.]|uniref:type IV secretory system conjugative DNA transfer family protein n=1 Tax=Methylobacter sp. TaxID=2051955 RepID=UPI003DA1E23A
MQNNEAINYGMVSFSPRWDDSRYAKPSTLANIFKPQTFGSASFMTVNEAIDLGLTQEGTDRKFCPYLGAFLLPKHHHDSIVEIFARSPSPIKKPHDDELQAGVGNLITFGTTRSGKGSGQILTNLLSWEGSVFVLDVKGENYFHSAGYRATKMGQAVFRFAPFEEHSHIWNPIMDIRASMNWAESTWKERCQEEEDARYLANLIITSSGSVNDQFWEDTAKALLVGLLLHVRTAELTLNAESLNDPDLQHKVRERSMSEVARLIALKSDSFSSLLVDMSQSERRLIRNVGNSFESFLSGEGKMGQSIKAMLLKQTEVWSYERVQTATYKSSTKPGDREPAPNDFNFTQMRDGNTSFYLIIPPEYLSEYRSVLRVMIGCAIRELKNSHKQSKTDPDYVNKPPVLFMLDEFAQLAHMSPIEEGLAYLAGYDVRLWFFLQDINQLKSNYPNSWESFLANSEFKSFFGVNDINTAKLLSEMIGKTTVEQFSDTNGSSTSTASNYSETRSSNSSRTSTYTSRSLMTPDEIMHMPGNNQIVFFKGLKPIYLDLPKYYEFPSLKERSEIPPPQEIDFL